MISEIDIRGVYVAPIVLYGVLALVPFLLCRYLLARLGVIGFVWHPSLFDVALYVSILSLLVILY